MGRFRWLATLAFVGALYPHGAALAAPPPNDTAAGRITLAPYDSGTISGTNRGAAWDVTEPIACNHYVSIFNYPRVVWYATRYDAAGTATISITDSDFDTVLAVYRFDSQNQQYIPIACNDDFNNSVPSRVQFEVEQRASIYVTVSGFREASGNFTLAREFVPRHDSLSAAAPLNTEWALRYGGSSFYSSNRGATREPNEPLHYGLFSQRSVWHRWSPSLDGIANVTTSAQELDTVLAVYTGSSLQDLTLVASNDDFGKGSNSAVRFPIVRGTEYLIAVDGYNNSVGSYDVRAYTRPNNDDIANAEAIEPGAPAQGRNIGASREADEPPQGFGSVWYKWRAPESGQYSVTLASADAYGGLLYVYQGSSFSNLLRLVSGPETDGPLRFNAVAGEHYLIAVDSLDSDPPFTLASFSLKLDAAQ